MMRQQASHHRLRHLRILSVLWMLLSAVAPLKAAVFNLTLYNTESAIDENSVSLEGGQSAGDFAQLLFAGPDDMIDEPNIFGNQGDDDQILGTFYIGQGTVGPDSDGHFVVSNFVISDTHIGNRAFVRFWNDILPETSTHYGNSDSFIFPTPDAFGEVYIDIAPLPSSSRITDIPFGAINNQVPEPSSVAFMVVAATMIFAWRRFMHVAIKPTSCD